MAAKEINFLGPTDLEFFDMFCSDESCDVNSLSSVLVAMRKLCSDYHYVVRKNIQLAKIIDIAGIGVPTVGTEPFVAASSSSSLTTEPSKKTLLRHSLEKK